MLPDTVLSMLLDHLHQTRMGTYVLLAQVNRAMRRFFLSDYAWKRFDVHQVQGKHNIYTYNGYQLEGIAAHYYNWLGSLPPAQRGWHMFVSLKTVQRPWEHSREEIFTELYDQMNVVADLHNYMARTKDYEDDIEDFYATLAHYDKKVWQCWLLHPHNPRNEVERIWKWEIPDRYFAPFYKDRTMYSAVARHLEQPLGAWKWSDGPYLNPYVCDRNINLMLMHIGEGEHCFDEFLKDEDFLLESMDNGWQDWEHTSAPMFPNLADKLYARNPSVVFRQLEEAPGWLLSPHFARLRVCEDFMLQCLSKDARCFRYARELHDNETIVNAAVCANPKLIKWASERLQKQYWEQIDSTLFEEMARLYADPVMLH